MTTIIVTTLIALALACVVLLKSRATDPDQLIQPRPGPLMMGVQIICGDCSGDDYQPIRTCLDRYGRCDHCGGKSFLLASMVACYRAQARAERLREAHAGSRFGRVIPFNAMAKRASRSKKLAV